MGNNEIVADILESMSRSLENLTLIVKMLADQAKEMDRRLKELENDRTGA